MPCNNKLAAKLLSFVGLYWALLGYASFVIYMIELNGTSDQCSEFISEHLAERDSSRLFIDTEQPRNWAAVALSSSKPPNIHQQLLSLTKDG